MRFVIRFISRHKTTFGAIFFLCIYSVSLSYAAPLYTSSNTTLDPQCAPTDGDCIVGQEVSPWVNTVSDTVYIQKNIGINTTTPATALDVNGTVTAKNIVVSPGGTLSLGGNNTTATNALSISLVPYQSANATHLTGSSVLVQTNTDSWTNARVVGYNSTVAAVGNNQGIVSTGTTYSAFRANTAVYWGNMSTVAAFHAAAPFGDYQSIGTYYGLYLEAKSNLLTISNMYGVYQVDTTAKNFFAGRVGIGTIAPTTKLHVSSTTGTNTLSSGVDATLFIDSGTSLYNAEFKGSGAYTGFIVTNTQTGGAPFVQFSNTANSKVWTIQQENATNNNIFAIREGSATGTNRFTIAVGGNIGIGTTVPTNQLSIAGNTQYGGNGKAQIRLYGTAATTGGGLFIVGGDDNGGSLMAGGQHNGASTYTAQSSAFAEWRTDDGAHTFYTNTGLTSGNTFTPTARMIISSAGNVGIGTISPIGDLDITKSVSAGGVMVNIKNSNTSGEAGLVVRNDNYYAAFEIFGSAWSATGLRNTALFTAQSGITNLGFATLGTGSISFRTNSNGTSNERMTILSGGNVGIGTANPDNPLTISFNSGVTTLSGVKLQNNNSAGKAQFTALNNTGASLSMGVFGSAFGAGLANAATLSGSAGLVFMTDGEVANGGSNSIQFRTGGYNTTQERMRIDSTGKIGIGVVSPTYTLSVGNSSIAGIIAGFTNSTGTCTINPTTTSLSCSSDMNLKKDITVLRTNTAWNYTQHTTTQDTPLLDKVLSLQPVRYHWNTESSQDTLHTGFIAQDIEQLFPELVTTDTSTGYKTLNQLGLLPYTIAAVQELAVKVQAIPTFSNTSLYTTIATFLDGIAQRGEAIINRVVTNQVQTKQLCLDSVCITKDQLEQLLQLQAKLQPQQQIQQPQQNVPPTVLETTSSEAVTPSIDTTLPVEPVPDTAPQTGVEVQNTTPQINVGA